MTHALLTCKSCKFQSVIRANSTAWIKGKRKERHIICPRCESTNIKVAGTIDLDAEDDNPNDNLGAIKRKYFDD